MQQMVWNVSVSPLIFFSISQVVKKLLMSTILSVCSNKSARWLWSSWHNPCRPFWNEYFAWPINPLLRMDLMGYELLHWVQNFGNTRCILYAQDLFSTLFTQLRLCRSKTLTHTDYFYFLVAAKPSLKEQPTTSFFQSLILQRHCILYAAHLLCVELENVGFVHNPGGGY